MYSIYICMYVFMYVCMYVCSRARGTPSRWKGKTAAVQSCWQPPHPPRYIANISIHTYITNSNFITFYYIPLIYIYIHTYIHKSHTVYSYILYMYIQTHRHIYILKYSHCIHSNTTYIHTYIHTETIAGACVSGDEHNQQQQAQTPPAMEQAHRGNHDRCRR